MSDSQPKSEGRFLIKDAAERAARKAIRAERRAAELKMLVADVKLNAARITDLRKHIFKTEDQLVALGLTDEQRKIVHQFEEPKKHTAFGVESAAKLVEQEVRAAGDKGAVKINVENMNVVQLPPKQAETGTPLIIEVEVDK